MIFIFYTFIMILFIVLYYYNIIFYYLLPPIIFRVYINNFVLFYLIVIWPKLRAEYFNEI